MTTTQQAINELTEQIQDASEPFRLIVNEVNQVLVGQEQLVHRMLIGLLTGGHLLIEGVPGLAKTTAVASLARAIHTGFQRIQFTPDLLPADLIGTQVYRPQDQSFVVQKGPIFSNLVLADEINRAPAKVQSALLEAMQEHQVTIGSETFKLDEPFLVMATQNPVEQEGTYPLPEAADGPLHAEGHRRLSESRRRTANLASHEQDVDIFPGWRGDQSQGDCGRATTNRRHSRG